MHHSMEAEMTDDKEFRQDTSAYTAPAENGSYQFSSGLNSVSEEGKPRRRKGRNAILPVIIGVLILCAAGAFFTTQILGISLSIRRSEQGFSVELVRKEGANKLVRVDNKPNTEPVSNVPLSSNEHNRYEWAGETLEIATSDHGAELSFRQLYADCAPCIGIVTATDGIGRSRSGAVIVMSEDGALIASTHLLTGASAIKVQIGGLEYDAYIIGLDYATDLAVLKIDAEGLPTATFSGETVYSGDTVAVIGNPVGGVINITGGMISAVNPTFDYRGLPLEVLQFGLELGDIASGSALVNASGHVIGIVNADMASQLSDASGIGFAISMHEAKGIIDELLRNGFVAGRPSSGLTVSELPAAYAAYYEYPTCLYISAVQENSTAAEAGLQRGDLILTANGKDLSGVSDLYSIINGLKAGDWLTLGIWRDGKDGEVSFQLMEAVSPLKN